MRINLLSCWISESKMNVKKSSMMCQTKSVIDDELHPVFSVDDDILQEVNNQKYLGIVFDNNWRDQISRVHKKCLIRIPD